MSVLSDFDASKSGTGMLWLIKNKSTERYDSIFEWYLIQNKSHFNIVSSDETIEADVICEDSGKSRSFCQNFLSSEDTDCSVVS